VTNGDGESRIVLPQTYLDQPRWWHDGAVWLADLPAAVERQCRRWDLAVDGQIRHGSNAIALPVQRGGERLILRMSPPGPSTVAEVRALRFWDGRGTARLIDVDAGPAAMLLERVCPGTPASSLPIEKSIEVLGQMMRRLAVPAPRDAPSTAEVATQRRQTLTA